MVYLKDFNVVSAMEVPNQQRRDLHKGELIRREKEEAFNRNFTPPDDLEQRLTKDGMNGVINDMRAAFDRISKRLDEIMFGKEDENDEDENDEDEEADLPEPNPLNNPEVHGDEDKGDDPPIPNPQNAPQEQGQLQDPRVQELYDARGRWWGPVCVWDWVKNTNTQYTPIVGHKVAGYDKDGDDDGLAVNARPLDGARRYCGCCMDLLNSRFIVAKPNGEELQGDMFAHASELAPNGLAKGDVKLPCGHIMCVKCSHRRILTKRCEDESWGHENGGVLECPMDRSRSQVPNLHTQNIPLGNGYWVSADRSPLRATAAGTVYGNQDPRALWADRIRDNFIIPEEEQINDRGRFLRLPPERREQIEREKAAQEKERLERDKKAEEARLAEEARKAAEEAKKKDEAKNNKDAFDFMNAMGKFAEANENERKEEEARIERERKADEEKRILAEKAEAEKRAEERRKADEEARKRNDTVINSSNNTPSMTNMNNSAMTTASLATVAVTTLSTMNIATPSSISATTPTVQTPTVNATNAPAAPAASNNINNAETPSGNINAVTPNGVNSSSGTQNIATPNGTTSQGTSSHDMKPNSNAEGIAQN